MQTLNNDDIYAKQMFSTKGGTHQEYSYPIQMPNNEGNLKPTWTTSLSIPSHPKPKAISSNSTNPSEVDQYIRRTSKIDA